MIVVWCDLVLLLLFNTFDLHEILASGVWKNHLYERSIYVNVYFIVN